MPRAPWKAQRGRIHPQLVPRGHISLSVLGILAIGVLLVVTANAVVALSTRGATVSVGLPNPSPAAPHATATPAPPSAPAGYAFHDHIIGTPITFCVDDLATPHVDHRLREAATESVALWQATVGDLPIAFGGDCPGAGAIHGDAVSAFAWEPLEGSVVGQARFGRGQIDEADIVLDSSWTRASGECLLAVALHELGHVLGLDHQDDVDSIMKPVTDCRPSLSQRDIDAARYLYK